MKKSSGLPMAIIVIALLAVVGAGFYFYNSAKTTSNTNVNRAGTNSNAPRSPQIPANAPAGAPISHNMLGSPSATVTLEEFADFQCGSCAVAHPTLKEIQSIYNTRIRFIFRHFPLTGHDKGLDAALAAEAAGMQGKFWAMQDQLFTNQASWAAQNADARQLWLGYASKIGLDVAKFQADMAGIPARSRIEQDKERGRVAGVGSTPTVFINGYAVPPNEVTVAGLGRLIDAELQKAAAPTAAAPAPPANTNAK